MSRTARILIPYTKVYNNTDLTEHADEVELKEVEIKIASFDDIRDQFTEIYSVTDTEHKHPMYRFIYVGEDRRTDGLQLLYKDKLDFKDSDITFLSMRQDDENIVRYKDGVYGIFALEEPDESSRGVGRPGIQDSFGYQYHYAPTYSAYTWYNAVTEGLNRNTQILYSNPLSMIENVSTNVSTRSLPIFDEEDYSLVPLSTDKLYFKGLDDEHYIEIDGGQQSVRFGTSLQKFYRVLSKEFRTATTRYFAGSALDLNSFTWPNIRFAHFQSGSEALQHGDNNLIGFLDDSEGNLYVMCVCTNPSTLLSQSQISSRDVDEVTLRYNSCIIVCPISSIPKMETDAVSQGIDTLPGFIFDEEFDYVSYFEAIFQDRGERGEDYEDEGKDITGEGDAYDGLDNSDEVVGGDHDLTIRIDTDSANPNRNYGEFAAETGFFGSYKVTKNNLIRYSETVKKLKETAAGVPIVGTAFSEVANDMTTGVTEILMLPIDIADVIGGRQMLIQSPLAMGNVGVWDGTGSFASYCLGNHIEQSKLVMNNIYEWEINLGTIKHYYDNFLDFAPYSTASLYIPYIGTVELPINLIQSNKKETKNLKLSFRLDITSGNFACLFFVNNVVLCHWNGNCAKGLKVAVNDNAAAMRGTINSIMAMASAAAGFNTSKVATTGSSNAYGASLNSYSGTSSGKSQTQGISQSLNLNRGRTSTQANGGDINRSETASGGKNWGSSAGSSAFSSMNSGSTSSESLSSSTTTTDNNTNGATSQFTVSPPRPVEAPISSSQTLIGNGQDARGDMGWLDSQMIYLTIERPQWWRPNDYGDLIGYPTKKIAKLSSVEGFATVPYIHLRCRATAEEKARLQSILSQGVKF